MWYSACHECDLKNKSAAKNMLNWKKMSDKQWIIL